MVRGFPKLFESPGEGFGWASAWPWRGRQYYTRGLIQAALVRVGQGQEGAVSHIHARFPLICRKYHRSHPLGIFFGESPLDSPFLLVLFEIVFIICSTSIIRFLLKPLKQPRVISQMIVSITNTNSLLSFHFSFF